MVLCDRVDSDFVEEYLDPSTSTESQLFNEGKSQTFDHVEPSLQKYIVLLSTCMATCIKMVWVVVKSLFDSTSP